MITLIAHATLGRLCERPAIYHQPPAKSRGHVGNGYTEADTGDAHRRVGAGTYEAVQSE